MKLACLSNAPASDSSNSREKYGRPPALPACCRHVMQASGAAWKEGQLDFTGAQMVLTLRLIAVAVRCARWRAEHGNVMGLW